MFRVLSYPLSATSPVWPTNPPAAQIEPRSSIARGGNSSNTTVLHLFSHSGTHLDAPNHFNDQGSMAYQLSIDRFVFFAPAVIEVSKSANGMITDADLRPHAARLADADLALLRTGWSDRRSADPTTYADHGPMLYPGGARYLTDSPAIKGSSPSTRCRSARRISATNSRETHRI